MKTLQNALLIASLVAMIACGKDKKEVTKSNREIMSAHKWLMTVYTSNPPMDQNGTLVSDFYAIKEACEKDNLYTFPTETTITVLEGATKCQQTANDTVTTSTCILSKDQKSLQMEDYSSPVQINYIDDKQMKWEVIMNKNSVNYTINYVFESQ